MTAAFKQGFICKLAEISRGDEFYIGPRSVFFGGHAPASVGAYELLKTKEPASVEFTGTAPSLQHVRKPTFFERNPWILKPLINALNIRHGSGTPVTGFKFSF